MGATLVTLIIIFILTMLWLDGARARELAVGICKAACAKEQVQLLDDTVFLRRIALRWTTNGIRFRRMFRFEFSEDGIQRQDGHILMLGTRLESIHIARQNTIFQAADDAESADQ